MPAVSTRSRSLFQGALLMFGMSSAVALDTAVVRLVVEELHPFEIAFFRTLFSLLFLLPWLWRGGLAALATRRLPMHVVRAAGKLAALVAFFYAVSLMPLAEVTAVMFAMPLFAAIGAWMFLGEAMRPVRLTATLLGFAGVLVVVRPGTDLFGIGAFAAVGAALGLASVALIVKYLARFERSRTIVFWNFLVMTPMAALIAIPVWQWPSWTALAWLILQGLLGMVAQLCFARAVQLGDASTLMPLDFLRLPIVAGIAYLAFGEIPGLWTWLGAGVIFAATVVLLRDEARSGAPIDSRGSGC